MHNIPAVHYGIYGPNPTFAYEQLNYLNHDPNDRIYWTFLSGLEKPTTFQAPCPTNENLDHICNIYQEQFAHNAFLLRKLSMSVFWAIEQTSVGVLVQTFVISNPYFGQAYSLTNKINSYRNTYGIGPFDINKGNRNHIMALKKIKDKLLFLSQKIGNIHTEHFAQSIITTEANRWKDNTNRFVNYANRKLKEEDHETRIRAAFCVMLDMEAGTAGFMTARVSPEHQQCGISNTFARHLMAVAYQSLCHKAVVLAVGKGSILWLRKGFRPKRGSKDEMRTAQTYCNLFLAAKSNKDRLQGQTGENKRLLESIANNEPGTFLDALADMPDALKEIGNLPNIEARLPRWTGYLDMEQAPLDFILNITHPGYNVLQTTNHQKALKGKNLMPQRHARIPAHLAPH